MMKGTNELIICVFALRESLMFDHIEILDIIFSEHAEAVLELFCSLAATNHELLSSSRVMIAHWDEYFDFLLRQSNRLHIVL